nr:hypothetical protein [Tanacetum cinerariifolium]
VKHLDSGTKFLMYPRFVQVFLDKQVEGMSKHNAIYVIPSHAKKVFSNMRRVEKDFSGRDTPRFFTMLVPAQEEELDEALNEENVPAQSKDTPLSKVNTLGSREDSLKLNELMKLCTKLSERVLNFETTKTAQAKEISSLKRRVKRLEKKKKSRTHGLKILYKIGLSARVESSVEEQSLDEEDASKQGRNIVDIDADAKTILVNETVEDQGRYDDQEMFDTDVLNDEEVVVEDVNDASIATAATITDVSIDDITLVQALVEIKTSKPKAKGIIMQEPSETPTTATIPISLKVQDKGKARRPQVDEQDRLAEEKIQLIKDENLAWDNVQAMMDADYTLAARLQEEEKGELTIEEKLRLFVELMDKRKKHFPKLKAEEQRIKPPTKAQKRNQISKRAGDKLDQGRSKKQKVEDDKEKEELKRCLEIILDDEDDVTIDATHLSIKTPIIDYKIYKEGERVTSKFSEQMEIHKSSAASTDNRPPMLVKSDYESWKIRIERYIRGMGFDKYKTLGMDNNCWSVPYPFSRILLLQYIYSSMFEFEQESVFGHFSTLVPNISEGQGAAVVQVTRDKTDEEFTKIENNRELADIQATNILSQGLLRRVFKILNQTRTGKEIWDNVELLIKGSGKSLQQKKEELFDEYERFRAIGNESIHDYFVCFHKLINDMKITQLDILAHQINTKFVNNLPPYWAKYVTNVKNNKDISVTTYVELYTYLKSYEPHALKTLKKQEQSSSIVDPLAYLASTTHHITPTQPTNLSPSTSSLTLPPQPAAQSSNDAMLATMNQIVNLLSSFQKQFPPTNNQLRTSSNSRSHATVTDNKGKLVICFNCRGKGHVLRQCKEKKRVKDSQYFKDKMMLMEAKEKGVVLDAEAEEFLADVECTAPYDQPLTIMTTNIFKVSHEDVYDYDVDEGPHATAAFMANLSSTSGTNYATISHVNEAHTDDNQIFDNVNHLLAHEMHQEVHLDSDVESDIDDNTIPYHQYQLDSEV